MYEITGKKVTIITHSMGGLVTWHNLLNMDQNDKDKLVSSWIAIAPAFLGSQEATMNLMGLTDEINMVTNFKKFGIGLKGSLFYKIMGGFISLF